MAVDGSVAEHFVHFTLLTQAPLQKPLVLGRGYHTLQSGSLFQYALKGNTDGVADTLM